MRCSNCNAEIAQGLQVCTNCQAPLAPPQGAPPPGPAWQQQAPVTTPNGLHDQPTPPDGRQYPASGHHQAPPAAPPPVGAPGAAAMPSGAPPIPGAPPAGGLSAQPTQAPGTAPPGATGLQNQKTPVNPPSGATGLQNQKTPVNPPRVGGFPGNRPDSSGGQADVGTQMVSMDPQTERGTRIVDINLPPMVKKAQKKMNRPRMGSKGRTFKRGAMDLDESDISRGMDDFLASMTLFYKRLHRFDRWAVWVIAMTFLGAFLPWQYEKGVGLISGIQGIFGMASASVAFLTFLWIYLRTARRRLGPAMLLLQIVTGTALVAIPLYKLFSTELLDFRFGIYFCTVASCVVVALTLARLTRINV